MYVVLRKLLPVDIVRHICEFNFTERDARRLYYNRLDMPRGIDNSYNEDYADCQNANWIEFCTHSRFTGFVEACRFHSSVMDMIYDYDYVQIVGTAESYHWFYDALRFMIEDTKNELSPVLLQKYFDYRKKKHTPKLYVPSQRD